MSAHAHFRFNSCLIPINGRVSINRLLKCSISSSHILSSTTYVETFASSIAFVEKHVWALLSNGRIGNLLSLGRGVVV